MDRRPLLVGEGMVRVVAEELEFLARGLQAGLEGVDRRRLDVFVAIGEMALQRDLEVSGLDGLGRRQSVEADRGLEVREDAPPRCTVTAPPMQKPAMPTLVPLRFRYCAAPRTVCIVASMKSSDAISFAAASES